ncbi:MAG: class I adenylate-forming enzyme family protein [Candidatus Sulfotelmatobacter sp.]
MTIRETIVDLVARHEARTFLVDAGTHREITYGEFHKRACALAAELRRQGIRKGDRVGVMVPNGCELAILYFACIYLGAVIVPINPGLSHSEVHFILSSCKPVLVVVGPSCGDAVRAIHSKVVNLIPVGATVAAQDPGSVAIETLPEPNGFVPLEDADSDDLVLIMYTSGTTAKPKGLAHRIGSLFRNARAFARVQGIDQETRFYLTLSMAYMGGFYNLLVLPFLCGASVVVDQVFDARASLNFWDKVRSNQANALWFAPTVMSILLRMDRGRSGEEFCRRSIRHTFVGFAPLPPKVKHEFEARYGVRLVENYGLSETLFVTARSSDVINAGSGYVGEALPDVQLRVVTGEEQPVAPAHAGEVEILTPDLMAGYLDDAGNLVEMDPSQWFSTGDVGYLDDRGSLFITGRKKDIIIRGGVNISPAAIEEVLTQARGVADAAVVSIPHELYGEDVVAVLKLDAGVELESILAALVSHAKRNLAQHQQPARYIAIDEFPRTTSGKVQKARMRELVAEKLQVGSRSVISEQTADRAAVPN